MATAAETIPILSPGYTTTTTQQQPIDIMLLGFELWVPPKSNEYDDGM